MNIIAAVADNLAIGRDNKLLYHLPADMKHFRDTTIYGRVIMGRKTFESLPDGPLPDRENIVLTSKKCEIEGCQVVNDPKLILQYCGSPKTYIIGGESLYRLFLPLVNELIITHVHDTPEDADAFFPEFGKWFTINSEVRPKRIKANDKNPFDVDIVSYRLKRDAVYQPVIELFRDYLIKKKVKTEFEKEYFKQHKEEVLFTADFFSNKGYPLLGDTTLVNLTRQKLAHSETLIWSETKNGHKYWLSVFAEFVKYLNENIMDYVRT